MWIGLAWWLAAVTLLVVLLFGGRLIAELVARVQSQLRGGAVLHEAERVAEWQWRRGEVGR